MEAQEMYDFFFFPFYSIWRGKERYLTRTYVCAKGREGSKYDCTTESYLPFNQQI